jgi:DNA repair exonuclease SbcCD ATPase subunit
MHGKRLVAALIDLIEQPGANDEELVSLVRSLPSYLKTALEDFEALQSEIQELKQLNNLISSRNNHQMVLMFPEAPEAPEAPLLFAAG